MSALAEKHILFFTSTNLSCNPRCLKEVRLALSQGAKVTVVAFHLHNWSEQIERELNAELKEVNFHYIETTKDQLVPWLISSVAEKASRFLLFFFSNNFFLSGMAAGKRSWLLRSWVKKNTINAQLVIAHNPAAFYPAYLFAKRNNIPFALDIEDYHPGEESPHIVIKSISLLMQKLMTEAAYTSFASPLIKMYSQNRLTDKIASSIIVNNLFSKKEFREPVCFDSKEKIKLVWFSQYIDYNRGLEKVLPVLDHFQESVELTLIGKVRNDFFLKQLVQRKYIHCQSSLPQAALNMELSKYDIGLALEDGTIDLNRNICLTNKIWSYFQAGLYIIASDTEAQKLFMSEHPGHGTCTSLSEEKLDRVFAEILETKNQIRGSKKERYQMAGFLNWENESITLLNEWNKNC